MNLDTLSKKRTCLWIKGLQKLKPTNIVDIRESTKIAGNWFNKGGKERQKNRAKTFQGIAKAIAEQCLYDFKVKVKYKCEKYGIEF